MISKRRRRCGDSTTTNGTTKSVLASDKRGAALDSRQRVAVDDFIALHGLLGRLVGVRLLLDPFLSFGHRHFVSDERRLGNEGDGVEVERVDVLNALALQFDLADIVHAAVFGHAFCGSVAEGAAARLAVRREARREVDRVAENVVDELDGAENAGGNAAGVKSGLHGDVASCALAEDVGEANDVAGEGGESDVVVRAWSWAAARDEERDGFDFFDAVILAEKIDDKDEVVHFVNELLR